LRSQLLRVLPIEVVIQYRRSTVLESPFFIGELLIPDAARALPFVHQKREKVTWRSRPSPRALFDRFSLVAQGDHEIGGVDAEFEEHLGAQVFRLLAEDLSELGTLGYAELDSGFDVIHLFPVGLLLNFPGRAVIEIVHPALTLDVCGGSPVWS